MKYSEYREIKNHGSADFPVAFYHVTQAHHQYVMPLHWHRELEIIYVQQGCLRVHINSCDNIVNAGEAILIGSGALHRADPEDCVYDCIVFDLNSLCSANSKIRKYIQPLMNGDLEFRDPRILSDTAFIGSVRALCTCFDGSQANSELAVHMHLSAFLYFLYSRDLLVESEKRNRHQSHIVTNLIEWIEENYTDRITLPQLSRICALSEKYLCRLFKEYTGYTPMDYINRRRIERACMEMTVSRMRITEAAMESGFHDTSYFTKLFRRYKGLSPREYVRRNRPLEYETDRFPDEVSDLKGDK